MARVDKRPTTNSRVLQSNTNVVPDAYLLAGVTIGDLKAKATMLRLIAGNDWIHPDLAPVLSSIAKGIECDCEKLCKQIFSDKD